MLGNKKGIHIKKYVSDYVLFDLETTGMSVNDEVIEISAVKVRNGIIVDEFSELVNPRRPIPYAASAVNHIYDEMVADADDFADVLPRFLLFVGDDILVGHNIASFDMRFLYRDCEKYFHQTLTNDYVDTLFIAKTVFPNWRHRNLGKLAEYYGLSTAGAHRALFDCKMNQQVFENMGKALQNNEIVLEEEKVKLCRRCGKPMKKRNGMYGEFYGCTGYPNCRYTENLE